MKKLIVAAAFAVATMPGMVSAAEIFAGGETFYAYPLNGTATTPNDGTYECALLADEVKLGTSANTIAGVACNEMTNLVQVAVCHSGGSRTSGVACSTDMDPNTSGQQLPEGCTDTSGNSTTPSFKAFSLVSSGGTMGEVALNARCTETQLGTDVTWID